MTDQLEHKVVISGVGHSAIARQLDLTSTELAHDAILAAVADAGLTLADIDGLTSMVHMEYVPGASDPEPDDVARAVGLEPAWLAPASNAVQAIASGACRHAVVYRGVKEGSGARSAGGRPGMGMDTMTTAEGIFSYHLPVGALSPANWWAFDATRHMHHYGTTREQLGWIPVTQRKHAALNPLAIYQDPLTLDDYLAARMISTPLCMLDCDVPIDAGTAIVYSSVDTISDLRAPVRIEAQGAAHKDDAPPEPTDLWSRTDLKPSDVDVAEFYDGFSPFVLYALEKLGFCAKGESGPFVEGGQRISLGGELPINTWGGQLSGGRLHAGIGHLVEAVHQVRGEGGARQVEGAEVALMGMGIYIGHGTLLTKVR